MDRLSQLRGEAGTSRDSTLDTSFPPSEAYMTANETSSKYFSLSEVDSTFDITPIKDVSSAIDNDRTITESDRLISDLSPIGKNNDFLDSYKIGKQIEAANILSGGVDIFEDNDNSYDGNELVIDDNVEGEDKSNLEVKLVDSEIKEVETTEANLVPMEPVLKKDTTEVTLQIDGTNVDAIDIGNGLYLYRRQGEQELAAVQIDENQQQPSYKFLKVRENDEGNLEVYEEFQIEVPKEEPVQEGSSSEASVPAHVPIRDISDVTSNKVTEINNRGQSETLTTSSSIEKDSHKDNDSKSEGNGKLVKLCESRKSPVVGSFTPMTYHSTPNKEGIPLTKTMVDLQLDPNRHSDNVKKTIEVHTDSAKPKIDQSNKVIKDNEGKIKPDESKMFLKTDGPTLGQSEKNKDKVDSTTENHKMDENKTETSCGVQNEETRKNEIQLSDEPECPNKPTETKNQEDIPKAVDLATGNTMTVSKQPEVPDELEIINTEKLNEEGSEKKVTIDETVKKSDVIESNKNELIIEQEKNEEITCSVQEETDSAAGSSKKEDNAITSITKLISTTNHLTTNIKDNTNSVETKKAAFDTVDKIIEDGDKQVDLKQSGSVSPENTEDKSQIIKSSERKSEEEENKNIKKENVLNPSQIKSKIIIQNVEKIDEENVTTSGAHINNVIDNANEGAIILPETNAKSSNYNDNLKNKIISEKKIDVKDIKDNKLLPMDPKTSYIADSTTNTTGETKLSAPTKQVTKLIVESVTDKKSKVDTTNKPAKSIMVQNIAQNKDQTDKKTLLKIKAIPEQKPISNNAAVPFGKWTEVNRQAFLDRIKETKVPSNSSNGKQIKNSNDLNRRDVLKKIDSHRQTHTNIPTAKVQDFGCSNNRLPIKKEASVFNNKPATQVSKLPLKSEPSFSQTNAVTNKNILKQESISNSQADSANVESMASTKRESTQRKEINNQDLIDKTIEDIISRALPIKSKPDSGQDMMNETLEALQNKEEFDDIEKKMKELHGLDNMERNDDLLSEQKTVTKPNSEKVSSNKQTKIPNLLPFANKIQRKGVKENIIDVDSDEEVIEHEPITGDMDLNKSYKQTTKLSEKQEHNSTDNTKKGAIITENDFDKFVRRNSITYENCITVNFDGNEPVVQTVVQKDTILKTYSKQDRDNNKGPLRHDLQKSSIIHNLPKVATINNSEDIPNKNYQHSKVKMAYQSAMTVKRQLEHPITIIEDKPVKVVFMDNCAEFVPKQLNAYGKELSPAKKTVSGIDLCNSNTNDSLDSDIVDLDEGKSLSETKSKAKHQRKQVLTPVETPELELIEPVDLGIEVSPKKKRRTEERVDNIQKPLVPKKSYLLGRGTTTENVVNKPHPIMKPVATEPKIDKFEKSHVTHNTASAIDNLVKAAELLETQSENLSQNSIDVSNADDQQNTPVKRGRGRPRKYPLPEGSTDKTKVQTPQKKPRLSEIKIAKNKDTDIDGDESSSGSDGEMIRENWTMGKINENIVCPICNKLFRSENVVFKHVKHCTGPSPNRSDSGNKSPRRFRDSHDSETKSDDVKLSELDLDDKGDATDIRKKRKSRETNLKSVANKSENIVEDSVSKSKLEETKHAEPRKSSLKRNNIPDRIINNLICEFCGKTFRQLSYLVNHKLQHEKEGMQKNEHKEPKSSKSVFSCEVCKKEFRKLHHLVQHRFIHNSTGAISSKLSRKSSAEHKEIKTSKDQDTSKQVDDTSAGFRCEPCDKSFRKLHHLVEHRETHDGKNRQKNPSTVSAPVEKIQPPPQCEICKKTFRKLHHLIEHKEQHLETSSEKSDDKSVKSSLSTKDIIHECSLCYMVFPNEHSLNKHTVICQRKKRQSASKQNKLAKELENVDENKMTDQPNEDEKDEVIIVSSEIVAVEKDAQNIPLAVNTQDDNKTITVSAAAVVEVEGPNESPKHNVITEKPKDAKTSLVEEPAVEDKKVMPELPDINKIREEKELLKVGTPKKKADKVAPTITKRHKPNPPLPVIDNAKSMESSDDDEVRYMLNPDFIVDDSTKGNIFMKIRANKRSSLQIERPNSKDLVKRRVSLQHTLHNKIPRLKSKLVQSKAAEAPSATKYVAKRAESATDSDDSDVKYSFPKISNSNVEETSSKITEKKLQRKSLTEKRKSLSTITKRKSLGKTLAALHKAKPSLKPIKKRIAEVGHRCDCGQLFSSAALLARHTSLAHTPPRIRRRRSPPPPTPPTPTPRDADKPDITKPKGSITRKSTAKNDDARPTPKRSESKLPDRRSTIKTSKVKSSATNSKVRRHAAHKGVPIPEKMKKLMEKSKK